MSIDNVKNTKEEQEIIDLSKQKWFWMSDKKVDTLSTLFHEKSMFVHMGGSWERAGNKGYLHYGFIYQYS